LPQYRALNYGTIAGRIIAIIENACAPAQIDFAIPFDDDIAPFLLFFSLSFSSFFFSLFFPPPLFVLSPRCNNLIARIRLHVPRASMMNLFVVISK